MKVSTQQTLHYFRFKVPHDAKDLGTNYSNGICIKLDDDFSFNLGPGMEPRELLFRKEIKNKKNQSTKGKGSSKQPKKKKPVEAYKKPNPITKKRRAQGQ